MAKRNSASKEKKSGKRRKTDVHVESDVSMENVSVRDEDDFDEEKGHLKADAKAKLIPGIHLIRLKSLKAPPDEYLLRPIDLTHVENLRKDYSTSVPEKLPDVLKVFVSPETADISHDEVLQAIDEKVLIPYTLGGNHRRVAWKILSKSKEFPDWNKRTRIQVQIYVGLTADEGLYVAAEDNVEVAYSKPFSGATFVKLYREEALKALGPEKVRNSLPLPIKNPESRAMNLRIQSMFPKLSAGDMKNKMKQYKIMAQYPPKFNEIMSKYLDGLEKGTLGTGAQGEPPQKTLKFGNGDLRVQFTYSDAKRVMGWKAKPDWDTVIPRVKNACENSNWALALAPTVPGKTGVKNGKESAELQTLKNELSSANILIKGLNTELKTVQHQSEKEIETLRKKLDESDKLHEKPQADELEPVRLSNVKEEQLKLATELLDSAKGLDLIPRKIFILKRPQGFVIVRPSQKIGNSPFRLDSFGVLEAQRKMYTMENTKESARFDELVRIPEAMYVTKKKNKVESIEFSSPEQVVTSMEKIFS